MGPGRRILKGSQGTRGGTEGNQSSPTEYKGGTTKIDCQSTANERVGEGHEKITKPYGGDHENFIVTQTIINIENHQLCQKVS